MNVDVKKFTAFIVFNDVLRNSYYDKTEALGINSTWDVYHIQEGTELPGGKEIAVMQDVFDNEILPNKTLLDQYNTADLDFRENVRKKNESRLKRS